MDTIIHWVLIAYLIIAPTVAVFRYRSAKLALALVVPGATGLLLTRPDISSFGYLGMQATLERQIGKVQVTIEELQKLAAAMAKANHSQLALSGHIFHRLPTGEKFSIRDQIIASLKEIGVSDADMLKAQGIWINVHCDILLGEMAEEAEKLLPSATQEINKLPEVDGFNVPAPETLEKWFASQKLSSPRLDQLMDDYTRLWTTGSMKNPSLIPFNREMRMRMD